MSRTTSQSRRRGWGGKAAILFSGVALAQAVVTGSPAMHGVETQASVSSVVQRDAIALKACEQEHARAEGLDGEEAVGRGSASRDIPKATMFIWKARRNASESTPGDSDADGLPDAWELAWFGGLTESGSGNADGDGLSNAEEHGIGTIPTLFNMPDLDGSLGLVVYGALR